MRNPQKKKNSSFASCAMSQLDSEEQAPNRKAACKCGAAEVLQSWLDDGSVFERRYTGSIIVMCQLVTYSTSGSIDCMSGFRYVRE